MHTSSSTQQGRGRSTRPALATGFRPGVFRSFDKPIDRLMAGCSTAKPGAANYSPTAEKSLVELEIIRVSRKSVPAKLGTLFEF